MNNSIAAIFPLHKTALNQGRNFSLRLMLSSGLIMLLWTACATTPLHASELNPLAITMVESSGGRYFEPVGRKIVILSQPARLFVRIRNTSETSQLIRTHPEKAYSIELKDDASLTTIVKRKKRTDGEPSDDLRVNLAPGADKIIPIHINSDKWEGLPDIKAGKEIKFTARVIYETADGKHVYSESYTLIFNIME